MQLTLKGSLLRLCDMPSFLFIGNMGTIWWGTRGTGT